MRLEGKRDSLTIILDSGKDIYLPESEADRIRRQVLVLGYRGAVEFEREAVNDASARTFFKAALYRPGADLEDQLRQYRELMMALVAQNGESLRESISKTELRRVPRAIHLRLVMNTLRDYYAATATMGIEEFYDSLGYSKSTGNKYCHEGQALQEFFSKQLGANQLESIYSSLPADIGGCSLATIRLISERLSFRYISHISELSDIKCPLKRYKMLSNPEAQCRIDGGSAKRRLSDFKISEVRAYVARLNKGEEVESVLGAAGDEVSERIEDQGVMAGHNPHPDNEEEILQGDDHIDDDPVADSTTESDNAPVEDGESRRGPSKELNPDFNHLRDKILATFKEFNWFVKKSKESHQPHLAIQLQHGFLQMVNEGYRLLHASLGQARFDNEFDHDEP